MVSLSDFLVQRIAEDEATFRAAGPQWSEIGSYMLPGFTEQRALAECEAKRRIVELASAAGSYRAEFYRMQPDACDELLRLLALPYAAHPDYREEWKP